MEGFIKGFMKVDKIQQNYPNYQNRSSNSYPNGHTYNVSFAKKPPKNLTDRITELLPGKAAIKFMKSLEWLKGEIGGILITAVGTGLVAPFPIAFNPFVKAPKEALEEEKKDVENTKKYTAMRQPISAALAIAFQVTALKPIDKFLDVIFNNPDYSKRFSIVYDQSAINSKSYIEKLAKLKIKAKDPNLKGEAFDELLEQTKKEIEASQINKIADKFKQTGKIMVGERSLDHESLAELVNSQIDEYITDASKLKIDNEKLSFYSRRAKTLLENETYIREIFKDAPKDEAKMADFIKNLLSKETNPQIKELLEEISKRPTEIQYNRIQRTLARIDTIKSMCSGGYTYEKYLEAMTTRNAKLDNIITEFMHAKIKNPKGASDAIIKETIEKITKACSFDKSDNLMNTILHDTDTFNFDKEKLSTKIHKDIAKQYKEFVRNHYKSVNQLFKIIVGVCITLPITCNVLNWVYPRVMDKFFPELAGSKKAQKAMEGK